LLWGNASGSTTPLRLFRNPAYSAAITTAAFTGAALFGAGLLYPLYFQLARGQGVLATGLLLISMSVGTAAVMPFAGGLVDRFGGGIVSVAGGVATVATTLPFAILDTGADGLLVQILLVLRGMALALAVMPAATAAYKAVTREQLPDATTQVNILQRVGGALGGSIFAVVLAAGLTHGVEGAFHTTFWWLTGGSPRQASVMASPRSWTVWLLRSAARTWPLAITSPIGHSRKPSTLSATMPLT